MYVGESMLSLLLLLSEGGMSPRRLAMERSASGEHAVDCRWDAEVVAVFTDFNSSKIALACTNAVGSTGSLISSCTSWGVRRVSIVVASEGG